MRAYFFTNMYLSSLQCGLQSAHVVAEMFTKYYDPSFINNQYAILKHWAEEHKTIVILNAGYGEEIRSLVRLFQQPENPLPWAHFNEGMDALDGALTCVGIILPEEFYEGAKEARNIKDGAAPQTPAFMTNYNKLQNDWERALAERLNNYGLAR